MPPFRTSVDFDAIRLAIIGAIVAGTGLPEGQIVMLEGETMGTPRPRVPYMGVLVTTASIKSGFDWFGPATDAPGTRTGAVRYQGTRTMTVSFEAFGATHEQAYALLATWQGALEQPPVQDALQSIGLAVRDIGAVNDMSALLNTAYEGRAQMDVAFGYTANSTVDLGLMDTVDVTQSVLWDGGTLHTDTQRITRFGD